MIEGTTKYDFMVVMGDKGNYQLMGKAADDEVIQQLKIQLDRMIADKCCLVSLGEPEVYDIISLSKACGFISSYTEDEKGISVEVSLLPNENGKLVKDIKNKGMSLGISSRGHARVIYEVLPLWKQFLRWVGERFNKNWFEPKKRIVDGFSLLGYDLIPSD